MKGREKNPQVILLVEDDPDISFIMKLMFEREGFSSIIASKGEEVPQIMQDHSVDLVILDMLLPDTKGTEICKKLKENATTSHIPVVLMSAHPDAKEISKEAGADDFIAKPFEMEDLFSHINHLIVEFHGE